MAGPNIMLIDSVSPLSAVFSASRRARVILALVVALWFPAAFQVVQASPVQPGSPANDGAEATPSLLHAWVPSGTFASSALIRVPRYFGRMPPSISRHTLHLSSVRNARVSAQLVVAATGRVQHLRAAVSALRSDRGATIPASDITVRFVGYVPVEKKSPDVGGATFAEADGMAISGRNGHRVVADPLWRRDSVNVPARAAQPIWFTFHVPATIAPGVYRGHVSITAAHAKTLHYAIELTVHKPVLPDPGDGGVRLNVWLNPNALAVAYDVNPWSSAHWTLLKRYFSFLGKAGQRMILTTIVPQPWQVAWNDWKPQTAVGYDSMVQWSYDGKHWHFDFHRFDRYVRTARQAGMGPGIAAYSLLDFRGPQRLTWLDTRTGQVKTRRMKVTSSFWQQAWCSFMKDFSAHLKQRGWLDHTWLGFDERPADIIKPAMHMLHQCAPSFLQRTLMAGTAAISRYAQNLSLGLSSLRKVSNAWILKRHKAGKITTFYTWAGDTHPNTLSFSPAVESRMMGWIVARRHLDGYLHWALNDWTRDVFKNPVYAFSQGDEYLVYPSKDGRPMPSIRWELLLDGIEDAELVRMARTKYPHSKVLQKALDLATRHPDGRQKSVRDITRAHAMVVSLLENGR